MLRLQLQLANQIGVDLKTCAESLSKYEGIYRRHQILGQKMEFG